MTSDDIRLIACPHPFSIQRVDRLSPHGRTIREILEGAGIGLHAGINARVMVEDELVPELLWDTHVPHAGSLVTVRVVPMGGGSGGKDPLRTLLTIAVIAAAAWAGPFVAGAEMFAAGGSLAGMGGIAGAITSAGVTAVGMLAVNAIAPPPQPALGTRSGTGRADFERSASLSGMRNQINKYGPVPVILGRHRVYPPFGARPYTEIEGDDQYLRCLFIVGRGPLALSDFKIGETSIDEFDAEVQFREGEDGDRAITLFTDSIYEDALNIELTEAGGFQTRTTQEDADEISVDVTFSQGLVEFSATGAKSALTVEFEIQYAPTGTSDWSIGYTYEAVGAQESASMPAPSRYPAMQKEERVDRVIIDKSTGDISVLIGTSVPTYHDEWGVKTGQGPVPPPVPDWACPIAQVIRRAGDNTIATADITDERSSCLLKQNAGDFAPSAQSPESTKIDVAAGDLKVVLSASAARSATLRKTFRFSVAAQGQYDVRIRRKTADRTGDGQYDTAYWTALRTITHENPVTETGLAMVALRIKATDQLNGILDTFNSVAHSVLLDWDPGTSTWIERPTNNPASLYRAVLQHSSNKKALADSRIDLSALQAWHENCQSSIQNIDNAAAVDKGGGKVGISCTGHGYENGVPIWLNNTDNYDGRYTVDATSTTNEIVITATYQAETFDGDEIVSGLGRTYNHPIDFRTSVEDLLREIAAAGRAAPAYVDGKWSIVEDKVQTTPVQHFTPRNSWGFTGRKQFIDMPHAFRVRFPNEAKDFREDERIVYDDGYDENNATVFEQLELPGITHTDLVHVHGRYHIACASLRPEVYSWYADIEHIVCTRGDLVRVTHDVPMWGVSWGRIRSVTDNGTHATAVVMDEIMTMVGGSSYCIRFRLKDGSTLLANVNTNAGEQTTLTFTTPILLAEAPEAGDLGLFGEQGSESVELIIKSLEPGSDLTARITAVDAAPSVHDSDTSEIPDYDSQMTLPYDIPDAIGYPVVDDTKIRSDETVLVRDTDGSLRPRIMIPFTYAAGNMFDQVGETWIWYREDGSDGPWKNVKYDQYVSEGWIEDVEEGVTYELAFRYKLLDGRWGPWSPTPYPTHEVAGKSTAPDTPLSVSATAIISGVRLEWTNPSVMDFKSTFVYRNTADVFNEANIYKVVFGQPGKDMVFEDTNVSYGTTYYYHLKSCDTSGNTSDPTSSVNAAPDKIVGGDINPATTIEQGSGNDIAKVSGSDGTWRIWAGHSDPASAPFRVDKSGNMYATSAVIEGTIQASAIHIPDEDTTADSFHVDSDGNAWWGCTSTNFSADPDNAAAYILKTGAAKFQDIVLSSNVVITGLQSGTEIAIQGWLHDMTFSASDHDTVAWTSGTITLLSGQAYSIGAGNTGNMTAVTYIYFNVAASITVLQTSTTASDAVGSGKILVAVAEDVASGRNAVFQVLGGRSLGGSGKLITASDIAAGTITADEIYGNTITAAEIAAGEITATEINSTFGDLTISSGSITFSATDSVVVNAVKGLKVNAGADIYLIGHASDAGTLICDGSSIDVIYGSDATGLNAGFYPSTAGSGYFGIGWDFYGHGEEKFDRVGIYAETDLKLEVSDGSANYTNVFMDDDTVSVYTATLGAGAATKEKITVDRSTPSIQFHVDESYIGYFNSSGLVISAGKTLGIGVTSPSSVLSVADDTDTTSPTVRIYRVIDSGSPFYMTGLSIGVDGDGGSVDADVIGAIVEVDLESAMSSIGGNVYGIYLKVDADEDPAGNAYMLYLDEQTNIDYGIYQNGTADNYFGGAVGIGVSTPQTQVHIHEASSGSSYLQITNTTTGSGDASQGLAVGISAAEVAYLWNYENTNMIIGTNNGTAITIDTSQNVTIAGTLTVNGDQTGATDHVFDSYDDIALLYRWKQGEGLPFNAGDMLNRDRLLRDAILQSFEADRLRLEEQKEVLSYLCARAGMTYAEALAARA